MDKITEKVLAIDIGGTSAKYAYVLSNGVIQSKSSFSTGRSQSVNEFLSFLYEVIREGRACGIQKVGISSLGIFDKEGRCLGGVENLPLLEDCNLVQEIRAWYPEVEVQIMNDGVAAAMGEYWLGEGQGCENFLCVTLGTGVGCAIVIHGQPLLGSHFRSGEIGYSNYQGEEDYFEEYYSTKGILRRAAQQLEVSNVHGEAFVEKVKEKEPAYVAIFEEWMEALGQMLANAVLLLDPQIIVIGGGISGQKEWICSAIQKKMEEHLPQLFRGKVQVQAAKHGNDAGLLGAAEIYFHDSAC